MKRLSLIIPIFFIPVFFCSLEAQVKPVPFALWKRDLGNFIDKTTLFIIDDTIAFPKKYPGCLILYKMAGPCKNQQFICGKFTKQVATLPARGISQEQPPKPGIPFLTVHGSIMYDGFYQSNIDTPFLEKNIYQHSISTALEVTIKDGYPLRVYFTTRFSNTSLLRNFTDANFLFNQQDFKSRLTSRVIQWEKQQLPLNDSINRLEGILNYYKQLLNDLNQWLSKASTTQSLLEEKERRWLTKQSANFNLDSVRNIQDIPSIAAKKQRLRTEDISRLWKTSWRNSRVASEDSTGQPKGSAGLDSARLNFSDVYERHKRQADSLRHAVDSLQRKVFAYKNKITRQVDSLARITNQAANPKELGGTLKSRELPDSILPRGYRTLLALRSAGIGRNNVNFSELSVKNIAVNGLEAEYNPSAYLAVAAGTIDYRFRDYIIQQGTTQKQYVTAVRFGQGLRDGNHLFFTYFAGRKQVYNYGSDSGSNNGAAPNYNLMGWSVEGRYQLNSYSYVVAEAAKSSMPFYQRQQDKQGLLSSAFNFNQRSNEAYSLNLVTAIPATATKINVLYKKLGANFQSFSLFTTSSAQTAWAVQVSQPFFKNTLVVNASVKKNDFTNPYINQAFYTNTIFKSLQVTFRKKKLPVLSAGYYPSSQLTKLGNNQYLENLFYTFVATGSHFYTYHSLTMSTLLSYTKFYNRAADSNFIFFNTDNLLISQRLLLKKATLQVDVSAAKNTAYTLYSLGGNLQLNVFKWLLIGGSVKYNRQAVFNQSQVGYGANTIVKLNRLGDIQFLVQKTYLPGPNRQLVENDIGRLTYYKTF